MNKNTHKHMNWNDKDRFETLEREEKEFDTDKYFHH